MRPRRVARLGSGVVGLGVVTVALAVVVVGGGVGVGDGVVGEHDAAVVVDAGAFGELRGKKRRGDGDQCVGVELFGGDVGAVVAAFGGEVFRGEFHCVGQEPAVVGGQPQPGGVQDRVVVEPGL